MDILEGHQLEHMSVKERLAYVELTALDVWDKYPVHVAYLTIVQAILESGLLWRVSNLAKRNNLFGIKGEGTAGTVDLKTTEVINGRAYKFKQKFAANTSLADSFIQHKKLLESSIYKDVLVSENFYEATEAVQAAGYATDPNYSKKLRVIYERYF
jgi:flagellum-specific peptidoglycan hydrolase FlgJ